MMIDLGSKLVSSGQVSSASFPIVGISLVIFFGAEKILRRVEASAGIDETIDRICKKLELMRNSVSPASFKVDFGVNEEFIKRVFEDLKSLKNFFEEKTTFFQSREKVRVDRIFARILEKGNVQRSLKVKEMESLEVWRERQLAIIRKTAETKTLSLPVPAPLLRNSLGLIESLWGVVKKIIWVERVSTQGDCMINCLKRKTGSASREDQA